MKWIAVLVLSLTLANAARAFGPDDQYLDIYNEILQADNLKQSGNAKEAAARYLDAQQALTRLKQASPTWNTAIVDYRLDYLADQLQSLGPLLKAAPASGPATNASGARVIAPKPSTPLSDAQMEIGNLQEQVRTLTAANNQLDSKLKEALSVQPAAVSPAELAKAQDKIVALQKENSLLNVALDQARASKPSWDAEKSAKQFADTKEELKSSRAEVEKLKSSLEAAQKKLRDAEGEIDALRASAVSSGSVKKIAAERDKLKEELAARNRDLADVEAHRDPSAAELKEELAKVEKERDELKSQLATASPSASEGIVEQLRARVAALEAQPVPYTPEELALLNANPSTAPTALPAAPATSAASTPEKKHVVHSMRDLPPGAGALMVDAQRAVRSRDFATAAEKFKDILRQDENNVFVLTHLANAEFALDQTNECDKTVHRALALDPEEPAGLYVLGILRYRENRLDEALDALTLSAKYNPTNAGTQNYLGLVLADKGQRPAAETAFRKALAAEPDYVDAHYHLAIMYGSAKPPSPALAKFHYKRAIDLGHERNAELEKLIGYTP